ncbi:hypothetical protein EVAR_77341_1 [Eumeta japonica]|uniref:Uncharacterized protein n=1 Tax=Eumeta variegata TaxID=151549 RepID=A0A4C1UYE9_EUMVA|nr:hypothetical protein EVAR_77341_1 [Eumeta japonica]
MTNKYIAVPAFQFVWHLRTRARAQAVILKGYGSSLPLTALATPGADTYWTKTMQRVQYNARNSAAGNRLRMMQCAGVKFRDYWTDFVDVSAQGDAVPATPAPRRTSVSFPVAAFPLISNAPCVTSVRRTAGIVAVDRDRGTGPSIMIQNRRAARPAPSRAADRKINTEFDSAAALEAPRRAGARRGVSLEKASFYFSTE